MSKDNPYRKCRFLREVLYRNIKVEDPSQRIMVIENLAIAGFELREAEYLLDEWNINSKVFTDSKETWDAVLDGRSNPVIIDGIKIREHYIVKPQCNKLQKLKGGLEHCLLCLDAKPVLSPTKTFDVEMSYEKVKQQCENCYYRFGQLRFFVPCTNKVKGRILSRIDEYQNSFKLLQRGVKFSGERAEERLFFIDDRPNKVQWKIKEVLTEDYYLYIIITKKKKYYLLTSEDLEVGSEYIIKGLIIQMDDLVDTTPNLKLNTQLPLIFMHSAKKTQLRFKNNEDFIEFCKKKELTHDRLFNYLLSKEDGYSYRHPIIFEQLIGAWLFHSKLPGVFPIHLCLISEPDCGKTWLIQHLAEKFEEKLFFAPNGTLKGLIPSYKGNTVQMGHLIMSHRVAPVDEFLKMRIYDSNDEVVALNSVFEHKKQLFGSGNCRQMGQMKAKGLFGTNPPYHTKTVREILKLFPMSTMQRMLIYLMDSEHQEHILSEQGKQEHNFSLKQKEWLGVYDYLISFESEYDKQRVRSIYENFKPELDGQVLEYYKTRFGQIYIHGLIDGLIKLRCVTTGDSTFKATEQDYKLFTQLLKKIIDGYKNGDEYQNCDDNHQFEKASSERPSKSV